MPCDCTGCSCWSAFLTMMGCILLELEPEPAFLKLLLFRHFGHSNKKCDKYNAYPQYSNFSEVLTHQNVNLANSPPVSHTQRVRPIKDYSEETGEAAECLWGHSEWADILKWSMWIYENTYKRKKTGSQGDGSLDKVPAPRARLPSQILGTPKSRTYWHISATLVEWGWS